MTDITRRGLIVTGAALATGALFSPAEAATGSIAIRILSAGFIFGASGGSGVLTFEGHQYPLSIGGISAGATIGASGTDLVGTAFHLHSPADIEGIYSSVGAGLSVAGGRSAAQLTNARGVVLRLRGRQVGFMFSLDLSGMQISLRQG
jgi:lipid-binding SYLF domain-containing protein